jgi:hypothetical protein
MNRKIVYSRAPKFLDYARKIFGTDKFSNSVDSNWVKPYVRILP